MLGITQQTQNILNNFVFNDKNLKHLGYTYTKNYSLLTLFAESDNPSQREICDFKINE